MIPKQWRRKGIQTISKSKRNVHRGKSSIAVARRREGVKVDLSWKGEAKKASAKTMKPKERNRTLFREKRTQKMASGKKLRGKAGRETSLNGNFPKGETTKMSQHQKAAQSKKKIYSTRGKRREPRASHPPFSRREGSGQLLLVHQESTLKNLKS